MSSSGRRLLRAVLTLAVACFFSQACRKQPRLATLPAPAPKTVAVLPDPMENVPDPPAPYTSLPMVAVELPFPSGPGEFPPPPVVHVARPRRPRPFVGPVQEQEATPAPVPAAPPTPQLGQLLPSDDQRRLNVAIDRNLQNAVRDLAIARKRTLNTGQRSTVRQVEVFIRQAEERRQTDLVEARNLARKAAVLARDLAAR